MDVEKHVLLTRRLMWANKDSPVRVTTGVRIGGKASAPPKRRGRSVAEALGELGDNDAEPPEGLNFDD